MTVPQSEEKGYKTLKIETKQFRSIPKMTETETKPFNNILKMTEIENKHPNVIQKTENC